MPRSSEPEDSLADVLARARARLGLTPNGLAERTTMLSSTVVRDLEEGLQTGLGHHAAAALIVALELDPWEADRFLHLAGLATVVDWQRAYRALLEEAGYPHELDDRTVRLHAETVRSARARRRRP